MIIDNDNVFFDGVDIKGLSTTPKVSTVIKTGKGEAYNPLWIFVGADQALSSDLTIALETAADEAFTSPVVLGTYTLPKAKGAAIKAKVPVGNLGFIRLKATGTSTAIVKGALNAMLVPDVSIQ